MFEEEYFVERNPEIEVKHRFEAAQWIRYFSLFPTDKVFVHGCGYGQRLHCFLELGMNAWGMDVSEYARKNAYGKAKGRVQTWIPYNDNSINWFNLVVSVDVLEHIPDYALSADLIKLSALSIKAVYGITYIDNHNFPKDSTHITGKTKEEWKELLLKYYDRVYNAPSNWYENDMYLICYKNEEKGEYYL